MIGVAIFLSLCAVVSWLQGDGEIAGWCATVAGIAWMTVWFDSKEAKPPWR